MENVSEATGQELKLLLQALEFGYQCSINGLTIDETRERYLGLVQTEKERV
jgi:hypothetical protein